MRARSVFFALEAASGFLGSLVLTAVSLYRIQNAHLTPFQLVLAGTVMEGVIVCFQVPTGILADGWSRKGCIALGTAVMGLAYLFEGLVPHWWAVLSAEAVWALGYTFTHGATTAWLSSEVGDEAAGPLYLRAAQLSALAQVAGIGAGVGLGLVGLAWPLVVGGALTVGLGAAMVVLMPETPFRHGRPGGFLATARAGLAVVRRSHLLRGLVLIAVLSGAATEAVDRLWEAHFLARIGFPGLRPVVWVGIIEAGSLLLGAWALQPLRRRVSAVSAASLRPLLIILVVVQIVATAVFAGARVFLLGVAALWALRISRRLATPIYTAWTVPQIAPGVRATVLSVLGQADSLGEAAAGPALGSLASVVSVPVALAASAVLLTPVPEVLRRAGSWGRVEGCRSVSPTTTSSGSSSDTTSTTASSGSP